MDRSTSRRLAILVVVVGAAYAPFLGGGVMTDDFVHQERAAQNGVSLAVLATPDPFGFYRPLSQASYVIDGLAFGGRPAAARSVNLALHLVVLVSAFFVARLLLEELAPALVATIAFALTPKAPPIAVLWISARAELLMSVFVFIAVLAWIRWERSGGARWLSIACGSYVLAFASKESAALLPLVLLFVPYRGSRFAKPRVAAVALMGALGAGLIALRASVGALMPASGDPHYDLMASVDRWMRSARNYLARALPSPLALIAAAGAAAMITRRRTSAASRVAAVPVAPIAAFAAVWFLAFLTPVLPIVARNELYLYLPGFGLCLLAARLVERVAKLERRAAPLSALLATYILVLGGYQLSRIAGIHRTLRFSERFVATLASDPEVRRSSNVLIQPADEITGRYLRDAIGGYFEVVARRAVHRPISGRIEHSSPAPGADAVLECAYDGDVVVLRSVAAAPQ